MLALSRREVALVVVTGVQFYFLTDGHFLLTMLAQNLLNFLLLQPVQIGYVENDESCVFLGQLDGIAKHFFQSIFPERIPINDNQIAEVDLLLIGILRVHLQQ